MVMIRDGHRKYTQVFMKIRLHSYSDEHEQWLKSKRKFAKNDDKKKILLREKASKI